jgi:hypothetical protein
MIRAYTLAGRNILPAGPYTAARVSFSSPPLRLPSGTPISSVANPLPTNSAPSAALLPLPAAFSPTCPPLPSKTTVPGTSDPRRLKKM